MRESAPTLADLGELSAGVLGEMLVQRSGHIGDGDVDACHEPISRAMQWAAELAVVPAIGAAFVLLSLQCERHRYYRAK